MIRDSAHNLLYTGKVALRWSRVYVEGGYEEVEARKLYADSERNREAVRQLLAPLVDRKNGGGAD